jgi:hypothetical protein
VALTLAYYLIVTPAGLLMRLVTHPRRRRRTGRYQTYWRFTSAAPPSQAIRGGDAE